MSQSDKSHHEESPSEHPRGTLFVVGLYGVLLVLGWLAVFFFAYVPRGAVTR